MNKILPQFIDGKCTGCRLCVIDCPKKIISLKNKKAYLHDDDCISCSHCFAVCPENAVVFQDLYGPLFDTIKYKERYIEPGGSDPSSLINIIRSRRSVRQYSKKGVSRKILKDLIQAAIQAPSGSNNQDWQFVVADNQEKVGGLAGDIRGFFSRMNKVASNSLIRNLSRLFMGKTLVNYYNENMESVQRAIDEGERGNDLLFHGAPSLVIFHSPFKGSTPHEDGILISYAMSLAAHTMGLGTCYIGYAVAALNRMNKKKAEYGIPANHRIDAVLTVGYPKVKYKQSGLRKKVDPKFL